MKRVLVVSYFYPPFSSVGATRVSKMTRYLRDSGWESHVLTVDRCDLPETLSLEVAPKAITRAPTLFDLAVLPRVLIGRRRLSQGRANTSQPWYGGALWRAGEIYRHLVAAVDVLKLPVRKPHVVLLGDRAVFERPEELRVAFGLAA